MTSYRKITSNIAGKLNLLETLPILLLDSLFRLQYDGIIYQTR